VAQARLSIGRLAAAGSKRLSLFTGVDVPADPSGASLENYSMRDYICARWNQATDVLDMMPDPAMTSEPVQIAQFMGLRHAEAFDDFTMVEALRMGVPARSAEVVAKHIDPTGIQVNVYDFVPKSTLHRCRQGNKRLSKDISEQLWQIARVYVETRRQFGSDRDTLEFLMRPHPLLDDKTPFSLARETVAGAELVLRLLAQAEAGVAV
jgi:putative toxin-antitoxin system antitoxin component (TIGR02293 family)